MDKQAHDTQDAYGPSQKHIALGLDRIDTMYPIVKALASEVRLRMLATLSHFSMNVNELAESLHIPVSTAALNVKVLEDAGLLVTEFQPGARGAMKLCATYYDSISLRLRMAEPARTSADNVFTMHMPIGGYTACSVRPTCGIVGENCALGPFDTPSAFFVQERFSAQLLWFCHGSLTYDFSGLIAQEAQVTALELSFEACSEASNYRNEWQSDLSVWINGVHVGAWRSPGDFGGRRGHLNPEWWPDTCSQFGQLKTWRVDETGSYIDGARCSSTRISDLALSSRDSIQVRIGMDENAPHQGGMNLFGEKFGDHPQHLLLRVSYRA